MNDKDANRPMTDFLSFYSDAFKPINERTMNFFASDETEKALKSLSAVAKSSFPKDIIPRNILGEFESISKSYARVLDAFEPPYGLSDSLRSKIVELQVDTLFQLSRSTKTMMIKDLTDSFVDGHYSSLVKILNSTLSRPRIEAPDIAFIKTSKLFHTMRHELKYPRGFSSSLRFLNKSTADSIASCKVIKYETGRNLFISESGETDSVGLNVISSGKEILTSISDEIFTETELIDFMSFLSSTPMLALSTNTGQKIYRMLKELFNSGEKTIDFDKSVYYHCRSHKRDTMPFTYDQMLKAPNGLPWAGRYNHIGRSHYYFADSQFGAETEIKKHKTNEDVLQTVKLRPRKEIGLLDLSGTLNRGKTFLRYIRYNLSEVNDKMPREYLIPCFVADCCKDLGFDGIKYYGSKEYCNYVAWNDGYFEYIGMCD